MIPDFKTYIEESIWTNINKRSEGNSIRKEDDVDLLNLDGFLDYLNDRYEPVDPYNHMELSRAYMDIPIIKGKRLAVIFIYNNDNKFSSALYMYEDDILPEFIDELRKKYDVTVEDIAKGWRDVYILPKGKKIGDKLPNSFFIELIDYILDMKKPREFMNMLKRKK